tara:strand:+ start:2338 stop:3717 length:1380 start_codon:yes stop_codon:yes gene_type:complete
MAVVDISCLNKKEHFELLYSEPGTSEEHSALLGGEASINDASPRAFSSPIPGLDNNEELEFFAGNTLFNKNWVTSPSSTKASDGLGPFFNSISCSSCHFKDGRGRAPEYVGEESTGYLLRLSVSGINPNGSAAAHDIYGGQLQDQSINGVESEGSFSITYSAVMGQFDDGSTYELREPSISINGNYGAFGGVNISPRVANQMIGLGLLEAIAEEDILTLADPTDQNNDGITGRPNYVWDFKQLDRRLGRFGWKANQPDLYQQTCGAFLGDIGITTNLFSEQNCTSSQQDCQNSTHGGSPEITEDNLISVVNYTRSLAVPIQRNVEKIEVLAGTKIFKDLNCSGCHIPKMETSIHPYVPALSNQKIQPYTDLLLHDMGPGLADNAPDFLATGSEWRTPPLWGIGLFQIVNGHTNYLHDGRARNIEEAILWHGGEAENSVEEYKKLSIDDRGNLLEFLNSL